MTKSDSSLYVSWSGKSDWSYFGSFSLDIKYLGIGDFDGNGTTDLFYRDDQNRWVARFHNMNSRTAPSLWEKTGASGYDVPNIRFGDFDGNGVTDIFRIKNGNWLVSFGSEGKGSHSSWTTIQRDSRTSLDTVILGDFDGDGTTDVHFWAGYYDQNDNSWLISYGQKGQQSWGHLNYKRAGRSRLNPSNFKVGDFNNDNRDDIISPTSYQGGGWYVSYGLANKTLSGWNVLNHLGSVFNHEAVRVGDLNGNGKDDLIFINTNGETASIIINTNKPSND